MNEITIIGLAALGIVLIVVVLILGLALLGMVIEGAIALLAYASEQGFVGIITYFAAWVFLFPLMITLSIVIGVLSTASTISEESEARKIRSGKPPRNFRERYRWANRLPPYNGEENKEASTFRNKTRREPPEEPEERIKWANRLPPYDKS